MAIAALIFVMLIFVIKLGSFSERLSIELIIESAIETVFGMAISPP
jgi:hypothetical protein